MKVSYNYLAEKAKDADVVLAKIRNVVNSGDFTLGRELAQFEQDFAQYIGVKHAIGVGSGTDALFFALKAKGIGPDDEVLTTPYTFYATVGAIVQAGARPVFSDIGEDLNLDMLNLKLTQGTKCVLPVAFGGTPSAYPVTIDIEDACQAVGASVNGRKIGRRALSAFSLHPLKNLHIWGDGGVVTTDSDEIAYKIRLWRNHGLEDRDRWITFGYNSRLDTIQAVVARHYLRDIDKVTEKRAYNAAYYDSELKDIEGITLPRRCKGVESAWHLYQILAEKRGQLREHLYQCGIETKIHYPIPLHMQPACLHLGYRRGEFPKAEYACEHALSLPIHEFLSIDQVKYVISSIKDFYVREN